MIERDEIERVVAVLALEYHRAGPPDGEGEYGCPGMSCPAVQRLTRLGMRMADALLQRRSGETEGWQPIGDAEVQLLAWATVNCHTLARRALARSTSVYDREKWEHVLRICEKAGARSQGVLRMSMPTESTEGSGRYTPRPHPTDPLQERDFLEDSGEIPEPDSHTNEGHKTTGR